MNEPSNQSALTGTGRRKFALCFLAILSATGLTAFDRLPSAEYVYLVVGVVGCFVGGNAVEWFSRSRGTK